MSRRNRNRLSNTPAATRPRRKPITTQYLDAINSAAKPTENECGHAREMRERAFSSKSLRPSAAAAVTIRKVAAEHFGSIPDLTLDALTDELAAQCVAVSTGSMERPEAMLLTQAQTLDAIFQHLVQQGYDQLRDIDIAERFLRIAFRAQTQSRAALETLGYLKSPPMVFARQANVSAGPQQVNNGSPRAQEIEIVQNELLEQAYGKRLEPAAAGGAGSRHSEMAPVAVLNGAKDREGEGEVVKKRLSRKKAGDPSGLHTPAE